MRRRWNGWGLLRNPEARGQHRESLDQHAPVGQRTGGHDSALAHQICVGRRFAQLVPEPVDVVPAAPGAVASASTGCWS